MAKTAAEKRLDISVYLLKSSQVTNFESKLFSLDASVFPLRGNIPGGKFLPLPVDAGVPRWVSYVATLLEAGNQIGLLSQMPGGVLWVPRGKKNFIFTFGNAHMRLNEEWLEPEFGKKVALSVIPQGQVVEVRAEQVFAKGHIASERAPRASAVQEFGFEADRDLVSAVEGVPGTLYLKPFGGKVRGGTAFRFGMYFSKFLDTLEVVVERFDSGDYKKSWPQVDNLMVVRDDAICDALNAELDGILSKPRAGEKISLAAPALKSGDKPFPQHYVIGRMSKGVATAPYLLFGNWEAYLRDAGNSATTASAINTPVHFLDENEGEIDSGSMYQCFGVEVSLKNQPFVLSLGLTRFSGHFIVTKRGVRDGKQATEVYAGVPATDGRAGPGRA